VVLKSTGPRVGSIKGLKRFKLICQITEGRPIAGFGQVLRPVLLPQTTSNADSSVSRLGDELCATAFNIALVGLEAEMGPGTDVVKIRVGGRYPDTPFSESRVTKRCNRDHATPGPMIGSLVSSDTSLTQLNG